MTISPQNSVCPLADKGFLVTDAQTLPSLINAHPTVLVLLQSDPNKHPEVADSWVIIPEILKQFPATSCSAAKGFALVCVTFCTRYHHAQECKKGCN